MPNYFHVPRSYIYVLGGNSAVVHLAREILHSGPPEDIPTWRRPWTRSSVNVFRAVGISRLAAGSAGASYMEAWPGNVADRFSLRNKWHLGKTGNSTKTLTSYSTQGSTTDKICMESKKLAMLTHYGLISNVLQMATFERFTDDGHGSTATGAVPFSHSYGLLVGHLGVWRGDSLIVFPRFDMQLMLSSVAPYLIKRLYLVGLHLRLPPHSHNEVLKLTLSSLSLGATYTSSSCGEPFSATAV